MVGRLKALLAGFALGILLAPRSGRESRDRIREALEDLLDPDDGAPPIPADPPDPPVERGFPEDDLPDEEPIG